MTPPAVTPKTPTRRLTSGEAEAVVRAELAELGELDAAALRARALGEPTRLALAELLRRHPGLCVDDLARVTERDQSLISRHLALLVRAGLVAKRREHSYARFTLTTRGAALLALVLDGAG
jgi:DNA-binding transcriptional ArsR family regulator